MKEKEPKQFHPLTFSTLHTKIHHNLLIKVLSETIKLIFKTETCTRVDSFSISEYVMRCAIWYHLYNLKSMKNTHGGVLILVKLQSSACNITKINTPP